jgi:hypothetical protein
VEHPQRNIKLMIVTYRRILRKTCLFMEDELKLDAFVSFQNEKVAAYKIAGYSDMVNNPQNHKLIYTTLLQHWEAQAQETGWYP